MKAVSISGRPESFIAYDDVWVPRSSMKGDNWFAEKDEFIGYFYVQNNI